MTDNFVNWFFEKTVYRKYHDAQYLDETSAYIPCPGQSYHRAAANSFDAYVTWDSGWAQVKCCFGDACEDARRYAAAHLNSLLEEKVDEACEAYLHAVEAEAAAAPAVAGPMLADKPVLPGMDEHHSAGGNE